MKTKRRFVAMPCFRCGRNGHYADECFARTNKNGKSHRDEDEETCFRCGRQGHWVDECYARNHIDGRLLSINSATKTDGPGVMDCNGLRRTVMDCDGLLLTATDCGGLRRTATDCYRLRRTACTNMDCNAPFDVSYFVSNGLFQYGENNKRT